MSLVSLGLVLALVQPAFSGPLPQIEVEVIDVPRFDPEINEGLFEGDIILPVARNAQKAAVYHWPGGVVPYVINKAFPSAVQQTIVQAMREIEGDTSHGGKQCIHFVPRTSQHDYIHIQQLIGCHSTVGHVGGAQEVSLGHGCEKKGTIMHELLHSLGFFHEHNRYDRDAFVTVNWNNINRTMFKDFEKRSETDTTTLNQAYDYGSVMHYNAYAFAVDTATPTLLPKKSGVTIGQRLQLSPTDVRKIQLLYGCPVDTSHVVSGGPHITVLVECSFEAGLCTLQQDTGDDFDWGRVLGSTHSPGSGPNGDHTNGAGYYAVVEAKGHQHKVAHLVTPTIHALSVCIDFALYAHGPGVQSLGLRVQGAGFNQVVKSWPGSQPAGWTQNRINLNVPKEWKMSFEATMGSSDQGAIAIDDVIIYEGKCVS